MTTTNTTSQIRGPAEVPAEAGQAAAPGQRDLHPRPPEAALDECTPRPPQPAVKGYRNEDEFSVCRMGSPRPLASGRVAAPEESCGGRRRACWSTLEVHGPGSACNLSSLFFQAWRHWADAGTAVACGAGHGRVCPGHRGRHVQRRAQWNGMSSAHYQVGCAEMLLLELRGQFFGDDLCAIVNPGQAGLSARAIRVLREYGCIQRLVCVSCQPEVWSNVPQARKVGAPFRLLLACPADMLPRTWHCELRLLFGH
ncbi:uncharacterized protein LOC144168907 isoform X1 [Haemaphysalis longicornis]